MSWLLAFLGFAALVILHEAGHFFAAKAVGMRVERFSLFFPPLIARVQARRDGVRDRRDPARRLREDHRHEPGGGDPAGARAPRLLPPAGVEADRRDRRRPGGQHRARVRDPRRRLHVDAARSSRRRSSARSSRARPPAQVLKTGDVLVAVDGKRITGDTTASRSTRSARRSAPTRARPSTITVDRDGRRADGHAATRSTTPRPSATASASATTRRRASEPAGPIRAERARARRRCGGDVGHGQPHRADLRPREAQGARQRRRRLRDHAPGDPARRDDRVRRPRASSRCRSASSTCSRSCRSTAGTSSGRWPRRCAARRSRSA